MFRRLGLLCAALAMFSIAGGHWAALQTVAWVGMLHDYSQRSGSWSLALAQTFDGQHPCDLCKRIAVAKGQESAKPGQPFSSPDQQAVVKADKQDKAISMGGDLSPSVGTVGNLVWFSLARSSCSSREEQPPTPPPRV